MLQTYEFTKIPNWAYDEHSFTLIIMGNSGTSKLLLETSVVSTDSRTDVQPGRQVNKRADRQPESVMRMKTLYRFVCELGWQKQNKNCLVSLDCASMVFGSPILCHASLSDSHNYCVMRHCLSSHIVSRIIV